MGAVYNMFKGGQVVGSDVSDEVKQEPTAIATPTANKKVDSEIIAANNAKGKDGVSILPRRLKAHCEMIYNRTEASIEQIELSALALYGFVLSYAKIDGVNIYAFDLSDTATGKSQNERLQREAICKPILDIQGEKHSNAYEIWKSVDKKDREQSPPKLINIHAGKTTSANLFKCFEAQAAQLLIVDEMGLWLESNSSQELLEYITKLYGSSEAYLPSLKSEISAKASTPARLSFIGMTTMKYFKKFGAHLEGGFGNRPLVIFNDKFREPEALPKSYSLDETQKNEIEAFTSKILEFYKDGFTPYIESDLFRKFQEDTQRRKIELKANGHDSYFYYARAVQNVGMIAKIIHSLDCVEIGIAEPKVSNRAVEEAIAYYNGRIVESVERLLFNLSGEAREERIYALADKVDTKIKELGMPCKMRDVYKPLKIKKELLIDCINGRYNFGEHDIKKKIA